MARARNIKPSFFTNELLGTYDPMISLCFAGLWCLADKEGRLEDRPLRIKAELFPYRDGVDVNGYLTVMERDGFITRYEVAGVRYIQVNNFAKHQTPHHTEKPKNFPAPPCEAEQIQDEESKAVLTPLSDGEQRVPERSDSLIPDSLIPDSPIPDLAAKPATPAGATTRGTRLPKDWSLPAGWAQWAVTERPGYPVVIEAAKFRDHWLAQSGQKGVKADWEATWRNWVRNTRLPVNPKQHDRHSGFGNRDYHEGANEF